MQVGCFMLPLATTRRQGCNSSWGHVDMGKEKPICTTDAKTVRKKQRKNATWDTCKESGPGNFFQ